MIVEGGVCFVMICFMVWLLVLWFADVDLFALLTCYLLLF